jgi:hypothetical protein
MRRLFVTLVAGLMSAATAAAQMKGAVGVGITAGAVIPAAPELVTVTRLRPTLCRVPTRGWGFEFALSWFDADVHGRFVGVEDRLGKVAIRPLMFGIGYTAVHGRLAISPSIVAGPALTTLSIDDRWKNHFAVRGSAFEERIGTVSGAVRPGVGATYAIASHLGLTAFGGYLFNRPVFTVSTPSGDVRTRWTTDGVVLNAGVVVTF